MVDRALGNTQFLTECQDGFAVLVTFDTSVLNLVEYSLGISIPLSTTLAEKQKTNPYSLYAITRLPIVVEIAPVLSNVVVRSASAAPIPAKFISAYLKLTLTFLPLIKRYTKSATIAQNITVIAATCHDFKYTSIMVHTELNISKSVAESGVSL